MYKMINEELRIASCKMCELREELADSVRPVDNIVCCMIKKRMF